MLEKPRAREPVFRGHVLSGGGWVREGPPSPSREAAAPAPEREAPLGLDRARVLQALVFTVLLPEKHFDIKRKIASFFNI